MASKSIEKSDKSNMIVDRIENGIVIDHMNPGKSLLVMDLLNIGGLDFLNNHRVIAVAMNVRSSALTRKDVLKISDFEFPSSLEERLGLLVPEATLNIIKNFEVIEKKPFTLPKTIKGLNCPSETCITNLRENVEKKFLVQKTKQQSVFLKCKFCSEAFPIEKFLNNWKLMWS